MLRFLYDECLPEQITNGVRSWNAENPHWPIDAVGVGEPGDLPTGTLDPAVLL